MIRCKQRCPPQSCTKMEYSSQIHAAPLHDDSEAAHYLHRYGLNQETLARLGVVNTSTIELAYSKREFTHIKQQLSMPTMTLFSLLGGQLSLWLGCSILTITHFFVFLLNCFRRDQETSQESTLLHTFHNYSNPVISLCIGNRRQQNKSSSGGRERRKEPTPSLGE